MRVHLGLGLALLSLACGTSPTDATRANRPPTITELSWQDQVPTQSMESPCCQDTVEYTCAASDPDDDALTIAIRLQNDDGSCPDDHYCWAVTQSVPAGQSARGVAVRVFRDVPAVVEK